MRRDKGPPHPSMTPGDVAQPNRPQGSPPDHIVPIFSDCVVALSSHHAAVLERLQTGLASLLFRAQRIGQIRSTPTSGIHQDQFWRPSGSPSRRTFNSVLEDKKIPFYPIGVTKKLNMNLVWSFQSVAGGIFVPKCCPSCYLYEVCENKNGCCEKCDFYNKRKCMLREKDAYGMLKE